MTNIMIVLIGASMFLITMILVLSLRKSMEGNLYEVLGINGRKLTVYSGIPVNYDVEDIESVVFSIGERRGVSIGAFYIERKNGSKSRVFFFDSSYLHKKTVLHSSREEIEQAIDRLTTQLREHGIPSRRS